MRPEGNVEVWLGEVERRMRASVRHQIAESMAAYAVQPRVEWVRQWPAMVVLAVSGIYWSVETEEAIAGAWSWLCEYEDRS
jgi:dynein heavy chain